MGDIELISDLYESESELIADVSMGLFTESKADVSIDLVILSNAEVSTFICSIASRKAVKEESLIIDLVYCFVQ